MAKKGGVPMARRMTTTIALAALVAGCATAAGGGLSGPADARTKTIRTASSITAAERQPGAEAHPQLRSEEHTSELHSLMRTLYAVFCLTTTPPNYITIRTTL